jgi:hypothetical protein
MKTARQHQLLDRQQKSKKQQEEENDKKGGGCSNPAESLRLAIDPDTILSFSTTHPLTATQKRTPWSACHFLFCFFFS